jgi:septal ring factor EnvC (AmiA/AmiB activator)
MEATNSTEWVIPQHKIMKKLDLMELRIMKLSSELHQYKDGFEKQNIMLEVMHNNIRSVIDKIKKQEENKDEDLKTMVKEIKASHAKLEDNLSSIYFKQRRDNIFWRSYNNKFSNNCNNLMGFKDMLFKNKEQEKELRNKLTTPTQSGETTPVILKISRKSKPSTPVTPITLIPSK